MQHAQGQVGTLVHPVSGYLESDCLGHQEHPLALVAYGHRIHL